MAAILFGSIGTIAETSELQRRAFNKAFASEGLDWHWSQEEYRDLLENSGGQKRITAYAQLVNRVVDARAIHTAKSEIFQNLLRTEGLEPRPGVVEVVREAKLQKLKLALVATTSAQNIAALFAALSDRLDLTDFDLVTDVSHAERPKPSPDIYTFALQRLSEPAKDCIAIEDNLDGVEAATTAGITCIAFPGANTVRHDFTKADIRTDRLQFDTLEPFFAGALAE